MARWVATGSTDFPVCDDKTWGGDKAREEIFKWAGWPDNPDPAKAKKCFFAVDADNAENKTAYKLPFCRVRDGKPCASRAGIIAVVRALAGARNPVDLPTGVIQSIRRKVATYYRKMGMEMPKVQKAGDVVRVAGWAMVFDSPDNVNDRFLPGGFYVPQDGYEVPVLYEHGRDPIVKDRIIGKASLRPQDPFGVFADIEIDLTAVPEPVRDELLANLEEGLVGLSTGTLNHPMLTVFEKNEEGGRDFKKYIPLELSLTLHPMDVATLGVQLQDIGLTEMPAVAKSMIEEYEEAQGSQDKKEPEQEETQEEDVEEITKAEEGSNAEDQSPEDNSQEEEIDGGDEMPENVITKADLEQVKNDLRQFVLDVLATQRGNVGEGGRKKEENEFTFGAFLKAVAEGDVATLKAHGIIRKAASTLDGASGGWLIPPQFLGPIWDDIVQQSVFLQAARKVPMKVDQTFIPVIPADHLLDADRGQVSVFGMTVGFMHRGGTPPQGDAQIEQREFRALPIIGLAEAENVFLEQAGGQYEQILRRGFSEAVAYLMDWAALKGNGVHQPLGVANSDAKVLVPRTANLWDDIRNMYAKLPAASHNRAVWYMSTGLLAEILDMTGPSDVVTFTKDLHERPRLTILGLPVIVRDYLVAGAEGDLMLVDPAYYAWGTPRDIMVRASEHAKFTEDKTVFRVTASMAGMPWISGVYHLPNGDTQAPFVIRQ